MCTCSEGADSVTASGLYKERSMHGTCQLLLTAGVTLNKANVLLMLGKSKRD